MAIRKEKFTMVPPNQGETYGADISSYPKTIIDQRANGTPVNTKSTSIPLASTNTVTRQVIPSSTYISPTNTSTVTRQVIPSYNTSTVTKKEVIPLTSQWQAFLNRMFFLTHKQPTGTYIPPTNKSTVTKQVTSLTSN